MWCWRVRDLKVDAICQWSSKREDILSKRNKHTVLDMIWNSQNLLKASLSSAHRDPFDVLAYKLLNKKLKTPDTLCEMVPIPEFRVYGSDLLGTFSVFG